MRDKKRKLRCYKGLTTTMTTTMRQRLGASFFDSNLGRINSDVCGLYDHPRVSRVCSPHDGENGNVFIICMRAGGPKKIAITEIIAWLMASVGIKLSYFDTRADPSYRYTAFTDCLDATRGISNRDSVLLARSFLWPVSGTKKVKNGHTWKRHKIAPGLPASSCCRPW